MAPQVVWLLPFASLLCTAAEGPTGCPYAGHLNCSRVGTVCAAFGDGGCDGAARTLLLSNASGLDACRGACEAMNASGCCVLSGSPAGPE